jgi:4-amino-4-deoxy-L-arabinose transferase-like glycosyltransferase
MGDSEVPGFDAGPRRADLPTLAFVCFITLAVTWTFWQVLPERFTSNEAVDYTYKYAPVARNVLAGGGYRRNDGTPETRLTPGFPLYLSALFKASEVVGVPEAQALALSTLVCTVASAIMLYLIARLVWSSRLALIPVVVWLTYPLALWLTKQPNSETPFFPVFFASVYLMLRVLLCRKPRPSLCLATGFVTGLAMLIRPIAIALPVVHMALLLLLRRQKSIGQAVALCFVLATGSFIAILPWELWLHSTTGKIVVLSTGGASGMRDGLTFAVGSYGKHGHSVPDDVRMLMETVRTSYDDRPSAGALAWLLWEEIVRDPFPVLKLIGLKLVRSWFATDSQRFEGAILSLQIPYLLLVVVTGVMCLVSTGRPRVLAITVWTVTLYLWAMTLISMSIVRYMIPAMGLLFVSIPVIVARSQNILADASVRHSGPSRSR